MSMEKALFGAGCFWGIEAEFSKIPGVISTACGYSGGDFINPTYEDVCTGKTGHAEVVQIEYDSQKVSYEQLLKVFWEIHDPTTLNRQGPDIGTQYRSAVFYYSPEQEKIARESKSKIKKATTEIAEAKEFYKAEEYHQKYFEKKGILKL